MSYDCEQSKEISKSSKISRKEHWVPFESRENPGYDAGDKFVHNRSKHSAWKGEVYEDRTPRDNNPKLQQLPASIKYRRRVPASFVQRTVDFTNLLRVEGSKGSNLDGEGYFSCLRSPEQNIGVSEIKMQGSTHYQHGGV